MRPRGTALRRALAVALLGLLPALGGCAGRAITADGGDGLTLPEPDPRDLPPWLRRPATERPVWLRDLPAEIERIPLPDDGFRANLG